MVSVDDVVAERPAKAMEDEEVLETGKFRFKFLETPHVPQLQISEPFFFRLKGFSRQWFGQFCAKGFDPTLNMVYSSIRRLTIKLTAGLRCRFTQNPKKTIR